MRRSEVVVPAQVRNERGYQLPNFLIIGAMKAGTTSLYHYLRPHPEVFMPKVKELSFFAEERNWRRGLGWYAKQFREAGPASLAIGEASPVYTRFPDFRGVPERIATHLPGVRLIYIVRDPIERIRSHYQHMVIVGAEKSSLDRAVFENPMYLNYSRYALQIEQYLPYVPRDRLLVITSESLRSDRSSTLRRVYTFLGVAPDFVPPTLDREFYRTQTRPVYPAAMWGLWRAAKRWIPGADRAKNVVDRMRIRRWHVSGDSSRGSGDSDHDLTLPDHVHRSLQRELRSDVTRLREFLPRDFEGWGLL
jgi:hypothetical protein